MKMKTKYIKTKNKEIIMFGEIIQHSSFKNKEPLSAGFISFGLNSDGNPTCTCYGNSISLDLESDEEDTELARLQFGFSYFKSLKQNKMKQTAVEWLVDKFSTQGTLHSSDISQAKAMEKEQIMDAFKSGNHTEMRGGKVIDTIAEQYYNETFKSE